MRTFFTMPPDPLLWLCPVPIMVCDTCHSRTVRCACRRIHVTVQTPACGVCTATGGEPVPDVDTTEEEGV